MHHARCICVIISPFAWLFVLIDSSFIYICMYVCTYIYAYICIYIYTHTQFCTEYTYVCMFLFCRAMGGDDMAKPLLDNKLFSDYLGSCRAMQTTLWTASTTLPVIHKLRSTCNRLRLIELLKNVRHCISHGKTKSSCQGSHIIGI